MAKSKFKLKNDRVYVLEVGTSRLISNQKMTQAMALEFLGTNTEVRKTLFSELPDNVDELLNPKKRNKKDE